MDYLRRGCRVSRIDHIRNSEIRRQMDGFEKASEKMKKRLRWTDMYGEWKNKDGQ
jgi:hypothetical protein